MAPRVFWLHVHYLTDPRQRVWAVETGGHYFTARGVTCQVPLTTVFRGLHARQPKAYLRGTGVVRRRGAFITIREH
jgi:hypothetical protein